MKHRSGKNQIPHTSSGNIIIGQAAHAKRLQYRRQNELKGQVHCFSMQVVINKCFLLNPEKKFGADPCCVFE